MLLFFCSFDHFHYFLQTLLAFVNYRLYNSINVKYPPILDPRLEALAAGLFYLLFLCLFKSLSRIMKIISEFHVIKINSLVESVIDDVGIMQIFMPYQG